MTRDIVTTLRTQEQMYRQMGNVRQGEILARAAEEIDRLLELLAAVKWEREVKEVDLWALGNMDVYPAGDEEIWASLAAARAEVDRLIAEGEG